MRIEKINNLQFNRKPNEQEMKVYTRSLKKGLELLDKQYDVIIHNSAAPSVKEENTGIGSLLSRTSFEKLFPFLKKQAVKGIQVEPIGMRKNNDISPYAPKSSAKNILMIPLEKLASPEYNYLLPFNIINVSKNIFYGEHVDYKYVRKLYNELLKEAYENFKKGTYLKSDFRKFKEAKEKDLEKDAIFEILDNLYQKDWTQWNGIDKNLYAPKTPKQAEIAQKRIAEIKKEYADELDFFYFNQMLIEKETKKLNGRLNKLGLTIIGDSPVASSSAEEWAYQNLYLKDRALGCPPDDFSAEGQRWGFKYFDPKKIFNPDGTLGEAGEILKKKYENYFENFPGGLRIDHAIGLVDPFIYNVNEKIIVGKNSGRIYSQEGPYKKHGKEFQDIITKIVIPAAEKFGVDKSKIIFEDLGTLTKPIIEAMRDLNLSGIAVTQYDYRGINTPEKNVIMIGSHDNSSFLEFVDKLFKNKDKEYDAFLRKTGDLGNDVAPKNATNEERQKYIDEIRTDKKKFIAASFAELFSSPAKRVQIFFTDFFGISKTYNRPGTTEGNWALRIGSDFENDYYKAVSEGKAPNIAQTILMALRNRGLDKGNEKLVENLENSAKILEEKCQPSLKYTSSSFW